jgi:tRNA dimethylallyltransferase
VKRPLIAVLGPTASGKSGLAEFLAAQRRGELVNADASALYRDLEVGVTKPGRPVRERLRYHLLDVAELSQTVTVVEYQRLAEAALEDIVARGQLPVLVGGSSLYVRALLEGYCPPAIVVPEDLRQRVRAMPLEQAVEDLGRLDPAFLARIDQRNPRRVGRALELVMASGAPVAEPTSQPLAGWEVLRLILLPEKGLLEARIRRRTEEMWDAWREEVLLLEKKALAHWLELRKPIGYGAVAAHLQGGLSRSDAIEEVVRATCLLAKKQRTWLQKDMEGPDRHSWVLAAEADWGEDQLLAQALAKLDDFLARFTE